MPVSRTAKISSNPFSVLADTLRLTSPLEVNFTALLVKLRSIWRSLTESPRK